MCHQGRYVSVGLEPANERKVQPALVRDLGSQTSCDTTRNTSAQAFGCTVLMRLPDLTRRDEILNSGSVSKDSLYVLWFTFILRECWTRLIK